MRAVVTRVSEASVEIEGKIAGRIGRGFLILLGIGPEDTKKEASKLAEKILSLRIFKDENDKMNLGLESVDGQVLVLQDMLGMDRGFSPKFLRRYADLSNIINDAVGQYIVDVKNVTFPNDSEEY